MASPEIENLGGAALADENVGGLDVAVDNAFAVRGIESICDLDGELEKLLKGNRSGLQPLLERLPGQEFHGDEVLAFFFADVVDRADIGMVQRRGGAGFAAKAFERLGIASEVVRKEFEGDVAAEADVFGFINHAHSATAEFFQDAVMADGFADHPRSTSLRGMVG